MNMCILNMDKFEIQTVFFMNLDAQRLKSAFRGQIEICI